MAIWPSYSSRAQEDPHAAEKTVSCLRTGPRLLAAAVAATDPNCLSAQDKVRAIDPKVSEGYSTALIVPDVPLLHTTQFLPLDGQGRSGSQGQCRGADQRCPRQD